MMAFVESTETTASVNGQLCRLWQGRTEDDQRIYLLVAYLVTEEGQGTLVNNAAQTPTEAPAIQIGERRFTG
jgi:hypothetical protein